MRQSLQVARRLGNASLSRVLLALDRLGVADLGHARSDRRGILVRDRERVKRAELHELRRDREGGWRGHDEIPDDFGSATRADPESIAAPIPHPMACAGVDDAAAQRDQALAALHGGQQADRP
jgi:hypothetical protein